MSAPWDTAARLLLCGLLVWRFASVLLCAAGLLCLWGGGIELATPADALAGAGTVVLGAVFWLAGRWLDERLRAPIGELLVRRRRSRRGR